MFKGRESSRYSWYMNADSGLWHCFTCGARGNLAQLVSDLSDDPGALWKVQSHLITTGLRRLTDEEAVYEREVIDWSDYFTKFAPANPAVLEHRNLDPDVAIRFGVRWDKQEKATIVPITSPLGELRGWQAKKTGWVRNLPEGVNKKDTLFGIERAFDDVVVVVESPLDVVRFHTVVDDKVNCVASFGANMSNEQVRLLRSKFPKVILALDNDQAGRMETKRLSPLFPKVWYWGYAPDDPKDIGEMTDRQIIQGLARSTR
jgi:DNA primase